MARYEYNGKWYTPDELSELCGIKAHTIRDRLRRGYTPEEAIKVLPTQDSVREFATSSFYEDWIGMSINDLHTIYWKWCISNGYSPVGKQGFSRHIMSMHPMLKIVPTKVNGKCIRLIKLRK